MSFHPLTLHVGEIAAKIVKAFKISNKKADNVVWLAACLPVLPFM